MPDISILDPTVHAAPKGYTIKGSQEIVIKAVTGSFDGTGAAGNYVPAVQVLDPSGFVVGTYTLGTTLTAGASADVSWFPGLGRGSGSGSGGGGGVRTVRIPVDTPDASGNAAAGLTLNNGWSTLRRVLPVFFNGVDGTWEGSIQVPGDYGSGGTVSLYWAANATTGNLRNRVGSTVVANNVTTDGAYTQESYLNTTVPGTARQRFGSGFALSTSLVAGSTLFVQVTRNGSSGSDTLAVIAFLIGADLSYTSLY
jgi:hypothetical protein